MFDRFTPGAQKSVLMAQEEARVHHCSPIGVDHLFLGILRMHDDEAVIRALAAASCSVSELYDAVDAELPTGPARPEGKVPFDATVKDVLTRALGEAKALGHGHIGNEHLLLAIVAKGGTVASVAMEAHGATHAAMTAAVGGGTPEPGFQVRTTKGFGRFRKGKGTAGG